MSHFRQIVLEAACSRMGEGASACKALGPAWSQEVSACARGTKGGESGTETFKITDCPKYSG